jgi:hypothetical protein
MEPIVQMAMRRSLQVGRRVTSNRELESHFFHPQAVS